MDMVEPSFHLTHYKKSFSLGLYINKLFLEHVCLFSFCKQSSAHVVLLPSTNVSELDSTTQHLRHWNFLFLEDHREHAIPCGANVITYIFQGQQDLQVCGIHRKSPSTTFKRSPFRDEIQARRQVHVSTMEILYTFHISSSRTIRV